MARNRQSRTLGGHTEAVVDLEIYLRRLDEKARTVAPDLTAECRPAVTSMLGTIAEALDALSNNEPIAAGLFAAAAQVGGREVKSCATGAKEQATAAGVIAAALVGRGREYTARGQAERQKSETETRQAAIRLKLLEED